ncbi:PAB1-binding protein 1 [Smittium culicis]|uniref:PAB1-binding protein 1 n=1 Tax=Smittium culicis TaxID=133412 RepID=A0A1R1YDU2_9FUNG|nr:PAB1-binding protein 1 [Smittium culicis]OMJ25077.1 PAB1-binding protein 1 [Smittium culicis]
MHANGAKNSSQKKKIDKKASFKHKPTSHPDFPLSNASTTNPPIPQIDCSLYPPLSNPPQNVQKDKLLFTISLFMGSQVQVSLTSGKFCKGILSGANTSSDISVIIKYAYFFDNSSQSLSNLPPTRPIDSIKFSFNQIIDIEAIVDFDLTNNIKEKQNKFQIDSKISKSSSFKERPLFKWSPDSALDPLPSSSLPISNAQNISLELDSKSLDKEWDQFAANEKLFGLTTNFDELIYTTKIDKSRSDYKEREREAIRIANEIQKAPALTSHVLEERSDLPMSDDLDEEDKYGAVIRHLQKNEKYISPYLRAKANKLSAQKPSNFQNIQQTQYSQPPNLLSQSSSPSSSHITDNSQTHNATTNPGISTHKAVQALAKLNIKTIQSLDTPNQSLSTISSTPSKISTSNLAPSITPQSSIQKNTLPPSPLPAPNKPLPQNKPYSNKPSKSPSPPIPIQKNTTRSEKSKNSQKINSKNSNKPPNPSSDNKDPKPKQASKNTPNPTPHKKNISDTKTSLSEALPTPTAPSKKISVSSSRESSRKSSPKLNNEKSTPVQSKLNIKAPLFIPNPNASAFKSKKPATTFKNTFFGSRKVDKTPFKLWDDFFCFIADKSNESSEKIAPTWPSSCGISYLRLITTPKSQTQILNQPQVLNPSANLMYNNQQYPQMVLMNYQYMNYQNNQPIHPYIQGDPNSFVYMQQNPINYSSQPLNPQFNNLNGYYNNNAYPANGAPIPGHNQNIQGPNHPIYGMQSMSPNQNGLNNQFQNVPIPYSSENQYSYVESIDSIQLNDIPLNHHSIKNIPTDHSGSLNTPNLSNPNNTKTDSPNFGYQQKQSQSFSKDTDQDNKNLIQNFDDQSSSSQHQIHYQSQNSHQHNVNYATQYPNHLNSSNSLNQNINQNHTYFNNNNAQSYNHNSTQNFNPGNPQNPQNFNPGNFTNPIQQYPN